MTSLPRFIIAAFVCVAGLMPPAATAQSNSYPAFFYTVEFLKPVNGASELRVHLSEPASPDQIESILTGELREASSYSRRQIDIMATALLNGVRLPLNDGSGFLVFVASTGKVMHEQAYFTMKPRQQAANALSVAVDIDIEVNTRGMVRILGKTNLPKNMIGTVEICSASPTIYQNRDTVAIAKGSFASEWFSSHFRPLPPGSYVVSFSTLRSAMQPPKVRQVTGDTGENLTGPLVINYMADNIVQYHKTFELK